MDFFKNLNYYGWQQNVKIIFLILTFIFLFIAVFAYLKAHFIMRSHREHMLHEHSHSAQGHGDDHSGSDSHQASPTPEQHLAEQWDHILEYVNSVREAEWKLAVIEADKYVDDVLKQKRFSLEWSPYRSWTRRVV